MPRFLKGALSGILTIDELKLVYSGFDIVGNIVVIKIPDQLDYKKNLIAEAILSNLKNVNTVLRQTSPVGGEYRIRDFKLYSEKEYNDNNIDLINSIEQNCNYIRSISI